ncbi:SCO family protein [Algoriphagus aquimarinus]|uniref:Protein SCO1/2 n=1 Tax=Algoriphagus aquimarinus TaxID=237018 RepID=A0A1I1CAK9_9BACT|nr:SCO family protein [Algoriphagus aquimarinus]SFB59634.1 protein SCO1/2 [Algoriphagus aquimarinus]|tara:strand:+ start:171218 stop:171892 length:675 start_codon:yes stop_codon:yes gene_type:complete
MRSIRILQGFVLVCILLVPILIFLFLKGFGTNNYDIPVFFEKGVDNPFRECPIADTTQHYIPEFSFTNQEGEIVGRTDMEGKITIVDFFFTSCPSICPKMSSEMERVNDMFREYDQVQIMSISIDPTFDTPEILKEYAEEHHAEAGKWNFLTGGVQETYDLAKCGFIIPSVDGLGVPDDFVHSDKFVLVDELGRIRGYYSGTSREDVDLLMLETKVLLHASEEE